MSQVTIAYPSPTTEQVMEAVHDLAQAQAERHFQADSEAQALWDRLQKLQTDLRARQLQGQPLNREEIAGFYQLQAEAGNHPTVCAFFEAEAKRYLQEINLTLSRSLGLDFAQVGYDHTE